MGKSVSSYRRGMDECGANCAHANLQKRDDFLKVNARSALLSLKWNVRLKVGDCECMCAESGVVVSP